MSIMGGKALTPCVGRCSHNVGDDVCRGCNRTVAEVRDWNTLSREQKLLLMDELKLRSKK